LGLRAKTGGISQYSRGQGGWKQTNHSRGNQHATNPGGKNRFQDSCPQIRKRSGTIGKLKNKGGGERVRLHIEVGVEGEEAGSDIVQ